MSIGKEYRDHHKDIAAGRRVALRAGDQEPIALHSDLLLAYFKTKKNLFFERHKQARDKNLIGNYHINHKLVTILEKEIGILKEKRALTEQEYEYLNSMMINNKIAYKVGEEGEEEDEIIGTMNLTVLKNQSIIEEDPPLISPEYRPQSIQMTPEGFKNRDNYT